MQAKITTYTPDTSKVFQACLARELEQSRINPCASCLWRSADTCKQCRGDK